MKRIVIIALLLLLCTACPVSAYGLYLKCPESVQAGEPLKCSVDSDFPPGTTFNLVLYQSAYTATQVRKQPITIQKDQNTQYVLYDTTGLPGGSYKAEMQYIGADEPRLRSDSITLQLVTIIDRSGDIEITSPVRQNLQDALRVEGEIRKGGNNGVEIEVNGPDGRVFGPQWIQTKEDIKNGGGIFTQKVEVGSGGDYIVDFSDSKGFIGSKTFTVVAPTTVPTTAVPTRTPTPVKTVKTTATTVPTPVPTTEQSPVSPLVALLGIAGAGIAVVAMGKRKE